MKRKNIVDLRVEKNITQQEMAKMLNISNVSLHYYETGQRKIPRNVAIQISKILGVKLDEIFLPESFSMR